MEAEQPRAVGLSDRLSVNGHAPQARQDSGRRSQRLAVQRHPPLGDHPLSLAPAGDARARQELGDAFALGPVGLCHASAVAGGEPFIQPSNARDYR